MGRRAGALRLRGVPPPVWRRGGRQEPPHLILSANPVPGPEVYWGRGLAPGTHTKRQVSKRQVSKRPVQNVRFQNV